MEPPRSMASLSVYAMSSLGIRKSEIPILELCPFGRPNTLVGVVVIGVDLHQFGRGDLGCDPFERCSAVCDEFPGAVLGVMAEAFDSPEVPCCVSVAGLELEQPQSRSGVSAIAAAMGRARGHVGILVVSPLGE